MLPDLMLVCRAICHEESQWIANALSDGIMQSIPQLNHKTRIVSALPSNGLFLRGNKLVIPLPPRDVTRTVQEKTPGVLGRSSRALWELTKYRKFYGWGYHPVTFPALEQSTLDVERFSCQAEVSPEVSNRAGYRGVMPLNYRFTGYYDPVHDRLYWLCHEHELNRFERLQASMRRDRVDSMINSALHLDLDGNPSPTIPSPTRVDWSDDPSYKPLKLYPDAPRQPRRQQVGKLDPSSWFNSDPRPTPPPAKWEPETDPLNPDVEPFPDSDSQTPPVDPKQHDPSDFKD